MRRLLCLLVLSVILVACGGGDASDEDDGATTNESLATTTQSSAAAEATPETDEATLTATTREPGATRTRAVASPTAISVPPTETPDAEADVQLGKWINKEASYGGTVFTMGEVINQGTDNAGEIQVVVTHYNAAGAVISSGEAYDVLRRILPGEKSPFRVMALNTVFADIAETKIQVQFKNYDANDYLSTVYHNDVEVAQVSWINDQIAGEIINNSNEPAEGIQVLVIGYDDAGEVFGVYSTYVGLDQVDPGVTAPFSASYLGLGDGAPTTVEAFAYGRRVVGAAAPASSTATASVPQATPTPLPEEAQDLATMLLTLVDMPPGWTIVAVESDDVEQIICNAPSFESQFGDFTEVEAQFQASDAGPIVGETIAQFPDDRAKEAMEFVRGRTNCGEWVTEEATWTISEMSFPDVGDESLAFRMTADSGAFTFLVDAVWIRDGDLIVYIAHLGLNQVDSERTVELVELALGKLD